MILMRCLENHIMIHILIIVGILSLHESCHFSRGKAQDSPEYTKSIPKPMVDWI